MRRVPINLRYPWSRGNCRARVVAMVTPDRGDGADGRASFLAAADVAVVPVVVAFAAPVGDMAGWLAAHGPIAVAVAPQLWLGVDCVQRYDGALGGYLPQRAGRVMAGDVPRQALIIDVRRQVADRPVQVFRVGHHGSLRRPVRPPGEAGGIGGCRYRHGLVLV